MNRLRALVGIVVFSAGALAGVLVAQVANPGPPESPWRALPLVDEPASSAQVAALLTVDDAPGLAKTLDLQLLQGLATGIEPLVDIDEVAFTGATERSGDILAAYVAGGRDSSGQRFIVGVVLRVRDGKVVGVN